MLISKRTDTSSPLIGQCLVAMPGMGDPRFHRAVIYMCAHDTGGAMGLVVNQPVSGLTFGALLKQMQIDECAAASSAIPVLSGGPVETIRGFVLHSPDYRTADTMVVDPALAAVSGTLDALKAVAAGQQGLGNVLFCLGYAGWGAGQLEQELQDNAWLTVPADSGLLYDMPADQKWDYALARMGIVPGALSITAGRA